MAGRKLPAKRAKQRRPGSAAAADPRGRLTGSTIAVPAPPGVTGSGSGWAHAALCAALAAAVLTVYVPALGHGFINFDDPHYVFENAHVRAGLSWRSAAWALTATHAGNWHPVTWWSHMIDVELFGLDARGHHATSILIHLVNTLLLFTVLRRMTRQLLPSALVAAFFGVHPLHVESVAWIAERKDVLSAFFALQTIRTYVAFVETRSRGRYGLALMWFVLGLATKPMLVTLPFVLLLLDVWPLRLSWTAWSHGAVRDGIGARGLRPIVVEKIPFFVGTLVSSVVTYQVQQGAGAVRDLVVLPFHERLATATLAYVAYIGKTLWPANLAPLYPYTYGAAMWRVVVAAALLAALTLVALRAARRAPYVAVGWFWFLGTLVPVIGLVQVGSQPMADRYMYLPLVGLLIVVAWGFTDLVGRVPSAGRLLTVASAVIVAANAVAARQQVTVWADSTDLWEHTLRVTRGNYRAHANLAHALAGGGRTGEAIAQYEAALRLNPDSVEARTGIGALLASLGRLDEAIDHYRHALTVRPDDATAHTNLGAALAARGRPVDGEAHLRRAVEIAPGTASVHRNLGIALARAGRTAEAVPYFSTAARLQPDDAAAHRQLGAALAAEGQMMEAIEKLEVAVRLDPADPLSRNSLGAALAGAGKLDAAAEEYAEAIRLNPSFAEARANLGNVLARLGRTEAALLHLLEAVRLQPEDRASRYDLAVALFRHGRHAEAREQVEALLEHDPGHEAARELLSHLDRESARSPERSR